jgi:predicted ester cyclase
VLESPIAGKVTGRAAIEKVYRGFIGSFPDLTFDRTDFIIDNDRVVQVSTLSGTDKGGFMDRPPTGKRFSFPLAFIFRLKDGLIVEEQRVYDFTSMLMQVGVLKVKPS